MCQMLVVPGPEQGKGGISSGANLGPVLTPLMQSCLTEDAGQ